jgi:aryl-alcohol dehydrogenase-like predicted oxidoreductase
MNLSTLDLYYLHNPFEIYGTWVEEPEFMKRLGKAFEYLEKAREQGKIGHYGMATWICFRAKPNENKLYLNL